MQKKQECYGIGSKICNALKTLKLILKLTVWSCLKSTKIHPKSITVVVINGSSFYVPHVQKGTKLKGKSCIQKIRACLYCKLKTASSSLLKFFF